MLVSFSFKKLLARITALITLFAMVFALSGCSFTFSTEALLTPPRLTEEQTQIYDALLEGTAQSKIDLRYPRTGENLSAFTVINLDDEPTNEAVVFYEVKNPAVMENTSDEDIRSNLRVGFLDKEDGIWRLVYEMAARGNDIESVRFASLGADYPYMIALFNTGVTSEKIVTVTQYKDKQATRLIDLNCTYIMTEKFTRTDKEDLLIFSNAKDMPGTLRILGYEEDGLKPLCESVAYSADVKSLSRITLGKCRFNDENMPCIAVDYASGELIYNTHMLYYNGKNVVDASVFIRDNTDTGYERVVNNFTPNVYSADIDNDGVIEVPVTARLIGYEVLTSPEAVNLIYWKEQDVSGIKIDAYTFIDKGKNFMLKFPERWLGVVTAALHSDEIIFCRYANNTIVESKPLLKIKTVLKTDEGSIKQSYDSSTEYTLYYEDDTRIVYVSNISDESLALTEGELKDALTPCPEGI